MNNTSLIVNRLIENDSESFEILNHYSKHNFGKVAKIYNDTIIPKMYKDMICCKYLSVNTFNLKSDILNQVIRTSSNISIKILSQIIYEEKNMVENIIIGLIKKGLPYKIDLVKQEVVLVSENKNDIDFENLLEKVKTRNENMLWNRVCLSLK